MIDLPEFDSERDITIGHEVLDRVKGGNMEMIDEAKQWLISVAARKMVIKAVTCVVAWLASGAVQSVLTSHGISYDPVKLQATLTATALTALKGAEDWANLRWGWNI